MCDRNGPKWSASIRGKRGDGRTETDLNGRLLPGKKGKEGGKTGTDLNGPHLLGYAGCVTGTDLNGRLLSGGRGVMEGQKRTKGAGSCEGKRDESGKTGTDLNGRHLLGYAFFFLNQEGVKL